jgi:hypothetical protein
LTPAGVAELAQVFDLRQFEQGKLQTCSPGKCCTFCLHFAFPEQIAESLRR